MNIDLKIKNRTLQWITKEILSLLYYNTINIKKNINERINNILKNTITKIKKTVKNIEKNIEWNQ